MRALVGRLVEQHRVVCIAATAGAGKTTAVLQTAAQLRRPTGGLSLDGTDVHPGRLLIYLEAAIARIVPGADGVAAAALTAQLPHTEVAGLLAEAVGESGLLLDVDNAEAIADAPEALAVISSFCRYLPRSARLVLVSRTVLPLDPSSGPT